MKEWLLLTFKKSRDRIYLPLLLFLLVFTIDKIVLKFAGILLIFLLHPDFNWRKNLKKIPLFYLLVIVMEIVKFILFNHDFSKGHLASFSMGCLFWLLSFLCLHQLRSILDENDEEKIYNTLTLFFLINAAISLVNLLMAMYHSGSINPYGVQTEEFSSSTGDLIKGLFLGPCYINMMINSFFLFYFLYKQKFRLSFLAMFIALLTTSNFANFVLLPVLIGCFIFKKNLASRLTIFTCLIALVLFYLFVSTSNLDYIRNTLWASSKTKQEIVAYQNATVHTDTALATPRKPAVVEYAASKVDSLLSQSKGRLSPACPDTCLSIDLSEKPGKLQSFQQTYKYLSSGPKPLLLGSGIGGFSSFLAERASKINGSEGSRIFQYLPAYRSEAFEKNHYRIFKRIYQLPKVFHSIKHFPNSFLNQILGEYGLLGALLFLLTYVLFFVRNFFALTYGKYLILLLGGYLLFDYLFEYLSVVVIFELMMLADIKRIEKLKDQLSHTATT